MIVFPDYLKVHFLVDIENWNRRYFLKILHSYLCKCGMFYLLCKEKCTHCTNCTDNLCLKSDIEGKQIVSNFKLEVKIVTTFNWS